jgi:hypothetical protein
MMNTRSRLVELGLLTALGLAGATGHGRADPDHAAPAKVVREHLGGNLNFIYFQDDSESVSMSGDYKDVERVRRFRHGKEPMVWFRDGGQEYIVRDAATLKQVDATWAPVRALGKQMGELGKQQGELGRQMGELGRQQGLLGTRQGTLAVRESALDMRASSDALSPAEKDQLGRQRQELRQQQRALRKEMRAFEKPMHELGARMEPLNAEMTVLNQKMEVASAKAETELRALLKAAVAGGTARPAA